MNAVMIDQKEIKSKLHPQKFGLWIGIGSIVMMFAGWTSAYLVRQAGGNWLEFKMPDVFFISTILILISSLLIHLSYKAFLKGNTFVYRSFLLASFVLGIAFVVLQYQGWMKLREIGVTLTENPSGSFIYLISGMHVIHVLGGIVALLVAVIHAFVLPHNVTEKRKLRFELTYTYWHFVDFLWLYLIIFFMYQQS